MNARQARITGGLATAVLAACALVVTGRPNDQPAATDRVPAGAAVAQPVAPPLPGALVTALQEGKTDEALAALDRLADGADVQPADKAYFALVRGIALRLDRKHDQARQALTAAVAADPKGPWAAKLRFELATTELAAGRPADAEALARAETEALLDPSRKDELAAVYQQFARRLLEPESPTTPADPNAAYELLVQARALAKGPALRSRLLAQMGRASQQAGDHGRAINDYTAYLAEFPDGLERADVRFHLAEAQLATTQPLPARLTWSDLARDLEKTDTKDTQDLRARSLFQVAATYGIPNPGDDSSMNLGIAALRRFVELYPSHELAVRARHDIGASYLARGKSEDALRVFRDFLAEKDIRAESDRAKRDLSELRMAVAFRVGQILQGQAKFAEAIDAFKGYLAQYPDGPQSADAQREILNTDLMIAEEHRAKDRYEQARTALRAFAAQNPLDARVPQLMYVIGLTFDQEKKDAEAVAAWETLIGKFPGTEPAAKAQFQIGVLHEERKGDPEAAIARFKTVAEGGVEPWASQARQRIGTMEAKALTVVTPRTFRSGETPELAITSRNIEKLTFTAYKLNPEAYFRKKQALNGVESLDIGLVAPDAEWTVEVPGYGKYKPIERPYTLDKIAGQGVHVVKVTDEKELQATTLVVASDLDAIVKASRDQLLVFAQDMKTGKGRPGARVLISAGDKLILEQKTGDDGVLLTDWTDPRDPGTALSYLILDGPDVAGSGLGLPGQVAQGLTPRAYIYTDRPAYRPGQTVALRGVVREVKDGQYDHVPGASYRLDVTDSRGRRIVERTVTLSDFGTFHLQVPVDPGAPVGTYAVRLYQPGKSDFAGNFEVQAYQLQKIEIEIDLPKTVYFRGEKVEGKAVARYQYGTPLNGRPIVLALPDGRTLNGSTGDDGSFAFSFETDSFAEEQTLSIAAQLPQDGVGAQSTVSLAVRAFRIDPTTLRDVFLDGETFRLKVKTIDALGEPTGEALKVAVLKRVTQPDGSVVERQAQSLDVKTDAETGDGSVSLTIDDEEGGPYVLRASGADRFGNPVVADRVVTVSGSKDEQKLRLLADRTSFKVGEKAEVRLHNRSGAGPALLTWEADRILKYQVVPLADGDNSISWEAEGNQFPNFTLTAARMERDRFHEARLDLTLVRDLQVTVKPAKEKVAPGEAFEVIVTTRDQLGRPVSAEVSLALVDRALLRLYADNRAPIGPFFHDQSRTGAFETEATNTFRYAPATEGVSRALVDEQERQTMMAQSADAFQSALGEAQVMAKAAAEPARGAMMEAGAVAYDMAAPLAATPGAPPPPMDAMMANGAMADEPMAGGGMGGMGGAMAGSGFAGREARGEGELWYRNQGEKAEANWSVAAGDELAGSSDRKAVDRVKRRRRFAGVDLFGIEPDAPPRQQFVETAYWNPSVVTDTNGTATIKLDAPTALSRYEFTARGVTGADTLAGQTTADVQVAQDFFAELKLPSTLTQGDRPRFSARVHHKGVKGRIEIGLTVYANGDEQVFPKTVEVEKDGVEEVLFDAFEIPDAELLELTLRVKAGGATDEVRAEVPVRPWGVQALATASGTASDDRTVFLTLPKGRDYDRPELQISLSPTLRRMIVELALGPDFAPLAKQPRWDATRLLPPSNTVADRAADLVAAASALDYVRSVGGADAPESTRLTERIRGLVAELVALQGDDGGWPWIVGAADQARPSEPLTSARVLWSLAEAERLGLLTDVGTADRACAYLEQEFAKLDTADADARAAILHALSTRDRASFEQANRLNRDRQGLSDVALAYLALTFANLDRAALGGEVLDILIPRSKTDTPTPGGPIQRYWEGRASRPSCQGPAEATALAALAIAKVRPAAPELAQSVDWLLAHRAGLGWQPAQARGAALGAIAAFQGRAGAADDAYRLTVTVNDKPAANVEVKGTADGQVVRVPRDAINPAGENRVRFDIEGRGSFGYAVTLSGFAREFGPEQDRRNRESIIDYRMYLAATPEFEGRALPVGFGVAVNPVAFENTVTEVGLGGRARVRVQPYRLTDGRQPAWQRDFLILEEYVPNGVTLIPGSIETGGAPYDFADGLLTVYYAPDVYPSALHYDVYGYLPGAYRALPARIRSAYDPGKQHLGSIGSLAVLDPGVAADDPYKPTPDELYARGQALFTAKQFKQAGTPLEALWDGYTLRDDVAKDAARMLLTIHIKEYDPRKVVRFFEVLREKSPEVVVPFDEILVVGRAYRDIGEHERAYLVWLATAEASYLEDARVGEALQQRGKVLEGIAFLLGLWREYPNSASIETDFFGLSQLIGRLATRAATEPDVRRQLTAANLTPPQLLVQSIRLTQAFLALSPRNPNADEASLALVNAYLDLGDHKSVVDLARRFAGLYPKSKYLDSFQYGEALGRFHLGQYDRAIAVAETIAKASYKDAAGADVPSPNKWQALYILGQIHHARRDPAKAVEFYRQVADQFTDAAGAVAELTREALKLPEVTVIRPDELPKLAARVDRAVGVAVAAVAADPDKQPKVALDYRNIAEADVKVYPVDLMRLYLTRRNLDAIAGIDLAGITPLVETSVKLGDGADYDDKERAIALPLKAEGAYLVMVRGDELYASGIALVTPLAIEVLEEPAAGRVRVTVRDAASGDYVPKVQVKIIGSHDPDFFTGETDLRGVFVAEGVCGTVTAVARKGADQYAFYRGETFVGSPPTPANAPAPTEAPSQRQGQTLEQNLRLQNSSNQMKQIERLQQRYNEAAPPGVQVDKAY